MSEAKVYVQVTAFFDADGRIIPRELVWEDGLKYAIDNVLDVRPAAAMKAGGSGDRYTIQVNGKQSYLYFERNASIKGDNIGRWFVERR